MSLSPLVCPAVTVTGAFQLRPLPLHFHNFTGKACAARTVINALIVGNLFVADLLSLLVTEQIKEGEKRGVAAGVPLTADDDIREEWQILAKIEGFNTCLDCPKLGALTP